MRYLRTAIEDERKAIKIPSRVRVRPIRKMLGEFTKLETRVTSMSYPLSFGAMRRKRKKPMMVDKIPAKKPDMIASIRNGPRMK